MGYITTIYSKLSNKQKNKIISFLKSNFISDIDRRMQLFSGTSTIDFELEDNTIIILDIDIINSQNISVLDLVDDENFNGSKSEIRGCICILDNKFLEEKLKNNNTLVSGVTTKDTTLLDYYDISPSDHGCFIYNLCVYKNLRNQNIATNLIKFTINKMKELHITYLHAHAENETSKNVFLKNNFEIKNKQKDPVSVVDYGSPFDSLPELAQNNDFYIMTKYI